MMGVRTGWVVVLAGVLAGCAGGPVAVPARGPHPPQDVAAVRVFQSLPKEYEDLGYVSLPGNVKYDAGTVVDGEIDELRKLAGAKGANGLVLDVNPKDNLPVLNVGGKYQGRFYFIPVVVEEEAKVMARAVWVVSE